MLKSESLNVLKWHSTFYFVLLFFSASFIEFQLGAFYLCTEKCIRSAVSGFQITTTKNRTQHSKCTHSNTNIFSFGVFLSFFWFFSIFLLAKVIFLLCSRLHSPCRCTHTKFTQSTCKMLIRFSCCGNRRRQRQEDEVASGLLPFPLRYFSSRKINS